MKRNKIYAYLGNHVTLALPHAFTIVELLVVIVVIGVLAAITIVSYTGVSQRAREASLKSNLTNASKVMSLDYVASGTTAVILPSSTKVSSGVGLSLSATGNTNSYCINGQMQNNGNTIYMYYDSTAGLTKVGACSGSTIFGSELGMNKNLALYDSYSIIGASGWNLTLSTNSGVTLSTRTGTSSDPIVNKPVFTITNTTSKTETWAVIYGAIAYSEIVSGSTYTTSYYARHTGGYSGTTSAAGVMDGNGTNVTIFAGPAVATTTSWQKISKTYTPTVSAISTNLFYAPISTSAFTTVGWTLEIQFPQITQQ